MGKGWLKLYIPARTAQVLRRVEKTPSKAKASKPRASKSKKKEA
jgi:hypothetical protein